SAGTWDEFGACREEFILRAPDATYYPRRQVAANAWVRRWLMRGLACGSRVDARSRRCYSRPQDACRSQKNRRFLGRYRSWRHDDNTGRDLDSEGGSGRPVAPSIDAYRTPGLSLERREAPARPDVVSLDRRGDRYGGPTQLAEDAGISAELSHFFQHRSGRMAVSGAIRAGNGGDHDRQSPHGRDFSWVGDEGPPVSGRRRQSTVPGVAPSDLWRLDSDRDSPGGGADSRPHEELPERVERAIGAGTTQIPAEVGRASN